MEEKKIKIGITHGDINGIGYEIMLKTLADARILELCTPVIYGSSKILAYHRKIMELESVNTSIINRAQDAGVNRISIINSVSAEVKVDISQSTEVAGEVAFKALESAVRDLKEGHIDVLLTSPVNKANIQSQQFPFPGHTEYLEQSCGNGKKALMILLSENMKLAPVTGKIPLSQVPTQLTVQSISQKLKTFHQSLIQDFGIVRPRIAVLSLNPRGGEIPSLGTEEQEKISPAMKEAEKQGVLSFGPFAADSFFGSGSYTRYDGILAMYYEQAMIPFKTLSKENGVIFTAGLPVIRTAPAHGVAYDIAGKNLASEEAFRNALYAAIDTYRHRKNHQSATSNPLKKQYFEKGSDNEKLDLTAEDN
ncbi:MAG: 4-hydroxythreonine-4-phosphate dehydrogenase PdxA [Dysgonamonadaceae bacterium]|jgi:4-hydroxythreonine-4-phosphate dehydrogenase|nr:4-hydroxythreonine-4-phosphate dehydrogenase PdxA [Dysgonamonadaceae bacterium]